MMEKQNAVERKEAAGDASDLDDVIDSATDRFMAGVPSPVKGRQRADIAKSK